MNVRIDHMAKVVAGASSAGETSLREEDARRWNAAFERELTQRQASRPQEDDAARERVSWSDNSSSATWMAAPRHSVEPGAAATDASVAAASTAAPPAGGARPREAVARAPQAEAAHRATLNPAAAAGAPSLPMGAAATLVPVVTNATGDDPRALGGVTPPALSDATARSSTAVAVNRAVPVLASPARQELPVAQAAQEGASPRVGTPYGPRHLQWTEGADGPALWIRDADPAFDEPAALRLAAQLAQAGGVARPARIFLNGRGVSLDTFPEDLLAVARGGSADATPPLKSNEENSHAH